MMITSILTEALITKIKSWAAIPAIGSAFFGSKVDDVVVQWIHLDGLERPARQAAVGLRPGQAPVSTDIRSPNRGSIVS